MTWWAVDVRTAPERRESVGAWLAARTGHAVEERGDGTLVTFAASEPEADRLIAEVRAEAGGGVEVSRRPIEPVDWSTRWRDGLGPRRVGRLTLAPSWAPAGAAGPLVVLDPETAFGSGEHGSTRSALALLERHLEPGDHVLDLGSGSGILAIAAAKLGASRAVGIELDPEANDVARRNAARNGVADRTAFLDGDAADLAPLLGPSDLLLSNILRTVNARLLPSAAAALAPRGLAIFAGMEQDEADLFRPALEDGFALVDEALDAGWWAVAARPR
ncbi:MAG TPA: 50S ribosomal protein L11 methyltransferase [Gemmatimonadales bacterium]|jgi:ribosomal protein L11 methyltransferase|nr:50S ribosomal protein L11 methyltransferase [Gemmatimonadales bacterium]